MLKNYENSKENYFDFSEFSENFLVEIESNRSCSITCKRL